MLAISCQLLGVAGHNPLSSTSVEQSELSSLRPPLGVDGHNLLLSTSIEQSEVSSLRPPPGVAGQNSLSSTSVEQSELSSLQPQPGVDFQLTEAYLKFLAMTLNVHAVSSSTLGTS